MTNLAALQDALNKEFQEPMSDLVARSNPLLQGLTKKELATDRIWLRHKAASNHNPRPIADGADVTITNPASVRKAGVLDWSTYISEFSLPKRLLGQVQNNPKMLGQLFLDEVQDAAKDLADRLAGDIFGGDVATGLIGIKSIMDTANTYAGIDRAAAADANAYWRGLVVDASAADLSTNLLYDAEEAWFERNLTELYGGESPTIFTSKRLQRKYKELFESIAYDALGTSHFVNQANASGQLGKTGVGFQGAPIVADHNVDATGDTADTSRMYILKPGSMFLACLKPNDDPDVARMQQLDASKAPTAENIHVQIEVLGNTGETVKGYVKTYVQLVTDKPSQAGVVVKNVSTVL